MTERERERERERVSYLEFWVFYDLKEREMERCESVCERDRRGGGVGKEEERNTKLDGQIEYVIV